ncbi:hypothetical protein [Mycobacterium deserti]|uniref:Secreted protein n=1 Tax=Mycobacterium deserti TaxID=2978347 RepID=A0ABT2MBA1_9MYCO|nr:hypothetical protein [Mycobacterium deserti]MCT7658690.1 hypothetical protein [Mycobacterium deserti]
MVMSTAAFKTNGCIAASATATVARTCAALAAAVLGAASLGVINAAPASAACANWKLPSPELALNLSNGETALFSTFGNMVGTGKDRLLAARGEYDGTSNGTLGGSRLDITVTWKARFFRAGADFPPDVTSKFTGTVGDDGIARGSAVDNKNFRVDWTSRDRFACADAPPPPPPPQSPPPQQAPPPQAPPAPKQGPTVTPKEGFAGVTFTVTDRSGVASQCTYSSEGFTKSFGLPANGTVDVAVPAIRQFKNRTGTITCDNGTSTPTSVFY